MFARNGRSNVSSVEFILRAFEAAFLAEQGTEVLVFGSDVAAGGWQHARGCSRGFP